jgi:hypothetical protein
MRPLSISDATSVLSLQQEIQRSEESRYDHRLHGVLLVAQGLTCPEVAGCCSAMLRVRSSIGFIATNYKEIDPDGRAG